MIWENTRKVASLGLLVFVAATVGKLAFQKWKPPQQHVLSDGVHVLLWHATVRCPTCRMMEAETIKCLEQFFPNEKISFQTLDYEASENVELAEKYRVTTTGIWLVRKEGDVEEIQNLTDAAWETVGREKELGTMLHAELETFLGRKVSVVQENIQEISVQEDLSWE